LRHFGDALSLLKHPPFGGIPNWLFDGTKMFRPISEALALADYNLFESIAGKISCSVISFGNKCRWFKLQTKYIIIFNKPLKWKTISKCM